MPSNSIVVIVAVVIDVNYWHLEFIPSVSLKLDRPETQAQVGTALMTTIELFEGTTCLTLFYFSKQKEPWFQVKPGLGKHNFPSELSKFFSDESTPHTQSLPQ